VEIMTKGEIVQQPRSKFLKVKCLDCENEQIIFEHAATEVKCLKCDKVLARPRGGKAKLEAIAREIEEYQ
jgi:small subunit ribosomal protein S27e